jgi:hypothetical protein
MLQHMFGEQEVTPDASAAAGGQRLIECGVGTGCYVIVAGVRKSAAQAGIWPVKQHADEPCSYSVFVSPASCGKATTGMDSIR